MAVQANCWQVAPDKRQDKSAAPAAKPAAAANSPALARGERPTAARARGPSTTSTLGEPHSNKPSAGPPGMRSMPPNATQTMVMQQPAQAQVITNQAPSQLAGGQRAAFKIGAGQQARQQAYAPAQHQPQPNLQQQQQQPAQPVQDSPSMLASSNTSVNQSNQVQRNSCSLGPECSLTTGPNTSTLGEPDDPSECSCSNSFDCLTDDGAAGPQSRIECGQLMGAPPAPMIPGQHLGRRQQHLHQQHQVNLVDNYHPSHHYHHHHHHQHLQQRQLHHTGQPGPEDDGVFGPAQMAAQQHVYQQQRALQARASVPPAPQPGNSRAYANCPPPPPPPLIRHSTYAATPNTFTDDSMNLVRVRHFTPPCSPVSGNHNHRHRHQAASYMHHDAQRLGVPFDDPDDLDDDTGPLIDDHHHKANNHFRRSATTREGNGCRWRPMSQQQAYGYQPNNQRLVQAKMGGSLQRQSTGRQHAASNSAPAGQQSRSSGGSKRQLQNKSSPLNNSMSQKHQLPSNRHALGSDNSQHKPQHNSATTTAFQYPTDQHQRRQQQQQQRHSPVPPQHLNQQNDNSYRVQSVPSANQTNNNPPNAESNGTNTAQANTLTNVSSFEAAATFCPPILTIPPPPLPIGPMAITSHRTNSPWMRLSSIILTPIGIVIAFFIVISPLLHYLW